MLRKDKLSHKLVLIIVIVNAIASILVTLTTLFLDYTDELKRVQETVHLIEYKNSESLALATWNLDKEQIEIQLKGFLHYRYLSNVKYVTWGEDSVFQFGDKVKNTFVREYSIPINYYQAQALQELGKLTLIFDIRAVWIDLIKKMLLVFGSQILKTILVSFVLYFILQRILIGPIERIASRVKEFKLGKEEIEVPDRKHFLYKKTDELDSLMLNIHEMSFELNQKHRTLIQMNAELDNLAHQRAAIILKQQKDLENERRMASLGRVAGRISHEINSPLTAAMMQVELLKEEAESENDTNKVCALNKLDGILENIKNILLSIKAFYRDSNKEQIQRVNLYEVLNEFFKDKTDDFKKKGIDFKLQNYITDDVFAKINKAQFFHVLSELVKNAQESMVAYGEMGIYVSLKKDGFSAIISVENTGERIPEDMRSKIFDPYFTTKKINSDEEIRGGGLGLTICKKFVEEMNGSIELDPTSEHTTFKIILHIA